ncbi:MAG: acetate--CoA ligase [bacterium]
MAEKMESLKQESRKFDPPKEFVEQAYIKSFEEYKRLYDRSVNDPEGFWGDMAKELLDWYSTDWQRVEYYDFENAKIEYFKGGKLNVSYNCLDRHIKTWRRNKAALIWEGDNYETRTLTYGQLYREVNRFANVLKKMGVKKGDRVTIYLPMILELPIAMLACTRIGAIHSIIFAGFSPSSIVDRVDDAKSTFLITADEGLRAGKIVPLKKNVDEALSDPRASTIQKVVVFKRTGNPVNMKEGRDYWWHELMADPEIKDYCEPEKMDAEDPLFILYTSGSTGKPKGVLHTTGGYLLYVTATFKYVFDYKDNDVYWCTADIGWVTGHSYIVYGPLSFGATSFVFEGVPNYPKPDRFWEVVEKYGVNIFYTAPTAIRAMMRDGEQWPNGRDLSSLRLLGTVGEPINPEAWIWYNTYIGRNRCPIVDTWWQTETGGHLIATIPGASFQKPGSAGLPFFGVVPKVVDDSGNEVGVNEGGKLIIEKSWPGMMRTVYGDHERFHQTYFTMFKGKYFTGDGARKDEDGYFWLMGRVDDVINVSGHRIGTAEVESALVSHASVAEAAVVGMPHDIKGQGIYAYVILKEGFKASEDLRKELIQHVRKEIGPIATPDILHFVPNLPKTRSGKIMRRILRKVAENEFENIGDTTTLADPSVVAIIIDGKKSGKFGI